MQLLHRTRIKSIQIIPCEGIWDTHELWQYWGCSVAKFLSHTILPIYPWKMLLFCLFIKASSQGATTKFSIIIQGQSTQKTPPSFWRSHRHVFTMVLGQFLRHLPRDSENCPRGIGVMESLHMKPVLAGHSSNARNMLSTLLAFQVKDTDKLLKIHHQYFHFPEVKVVASSKPPWRKGINKTTLKPKQLTRDLGWHKPLDAAATNFSWVGVSPAKAHTRATRRSCSGLAVVRRHCKQSTNTGLCWGLGRRRSSPPSDSWNCSAGNPSLHLKWIQVSQLPTSDQGGLSPVLLSPASSTFSKDEMTILVYFSAQVIITFSSLKKNQTQNQHARSHCFSLRSKTFNIGLKKSQWRIWWWCFSKSK